MLAQHASTGLPVPYHSAAERIFYVQMKEQEALNAACLTLWTFQSLPC